MNQSEKSNVWIIPSKMQCMTMNIQCVLTVCAFKVPVSYTNSRMWCDQWRISITAFTFVSHQSFAFTKGCCERDAPMWLSQILGEFRLQHLKIWQCCMVAWSSHTQQLRKHYCDTSHDKHEILNTRNDIPKQCQLFIANTMQRSATLSRPTH